MIVEKLRTGLWFLKRPTHWRQGVELALRKLRPDFDGTELRNEARRWAAERTVSVADALAAIGLAPSAGGQAPAFPDGLMAEARLQAERSKVTMGGPGDINLLYAATRLSGARRVVETGVAYGWSSLAILAALNGREGTKLVSVDMPYPKMNNEDFVGIVVPEALRGRWQLMREPDRNGLVKAIAHLGGEIDLCHYDSDKSYWGRQFGYRLMWNALRSGGVFISDDIQDNMAFKEFVKTRSLPFAVTEYEQKYVGILRKP